MSQSTVPELFPIVQHRRTISKNFDEVEKRVIEKYTDRVVDHLIAKTFSLDDSGQKSVELKNPVIETDTDRIVDHLIAQTLSLDGNCGELLSIGHWAQSSTTQSNIILCESIQQLTLQQPKRWAIEARVAWKGIRKPVANQNTGFCFEFILQDRHHNQIRVIAIGDQCDRWFEQIEWLHYYQISNGDLGAYTDPEDQRSAIEILLTHNSQIQPVEPLNQVDIGLSLSSLARNATNGTEPVNLLAVVQEIIPENARFMKGFHLVDQSLLRIQFKIWKSSKNKSNYRRLFDVQVGQTLLFQSLVPGKQSNRLCLTLNKSDSTVRFDIDPKLPEAIQLKEWWRSEGFAMSNSDFQPIPSVEQ